MHLTLAEILKITGGRLHGGMWEGHLSGAVIDSRKVRGGEIFCPLQGEKENGHHYIIPALRQGAAASLVEERYLDTVNPADLPPGKVLLAVEDSLHSLQQIAAYQRDKYNPAVVAVTGSNGKTTTKDFIASVLQARYRVLKTEGNFNNEIGLPLTLLRLCPEHQVAVVELGMRGPGEIALLGALCRPSLGVITNIGEAHLELLGSRENIGKAKGELLEALGPGGTAVLNGDDPFLRRMGTAYPGPTVYYGFNDGLELRACRCRLENGGYRFTAALPRGGETEFRIPLPGKHNVYNALAAVAVGLHFSLTIPEIKAGLAAASVSAMRMERLHTRSGTRLINDAYNASPTSMKFALGSLKEWAGPGLSIAVLGDMLELGSCAEEEHRQTGRELARTGIDYLITVGELAVQIGEEARKAGLSPDKVFNCSSNAAALKVLRTLPLPGAYVLVKGSRAMGMEAIVEGLLAL